MSISSISLTSTSYLYQTTLDSSSTSSTSNSSSSIKSLLSSLSDALGSGDTTTASSLWEKLDSAFKSQSGKSDDSSDSSDDNNPLKKDMLKLKSYIEQGDSASATQMLERIQKATSRGGPGGPPPPQGDANSAGTKLSDLLSSIGSAITNGDSSSASDYLTQLDELLSAKSKNGSSSSSSSDSSGSTSSTTQKNPLKEAIDQLQQYLQTGDTSSVQSLFQDIQRAVNHNPWTPELGTEINSFA